MEREELIKKFRYALDTKQKLKELKQKSRKKKEEYKKVEKELRNYPERLIKMIGGRGLLCGACGAGSETKTKTYWICNRCGKKFTE